MVPASGSSMPLTQLKSVVLPAPFGPMSPRISPRLTTNDTSSRARTPPKCTETWATSSSGISGDLDRVRRPADSAQQLAHVALGLGHDAFGGEQQLDDQRAAEQEWEVPR